MPASIFGKDWQVLDPKSQQSTVQKTLGCLEIIHGLKFITFDFINVTLFLTQTLAKYVELQVLHRKQKVESAVSLRQSCLLTKEFRNSPFSGGLKLQVTVLLLPVSHRCQPVFGILPLPRLFSESHVWTNLATLEPPRQHRKWYDTAASFWGVLEMHFLNCLVTELKMKILNKQPEFSCFPGKSQNI